MASWILAALLAATVGASPDVMIVEFTADWCRPCQQLQPAINRLTQEGWSIRQIDVDRERDLVERFRVQSLPTLIILSRGQEIDRIVGAAQYEQLVQRFTAASRSNGLTSGASPTQQAANTQPAQNSARANQPIPHQPTVRGQSPGGVGAFPMLAAASSLTSLATAASSQSASPNDLSGGMLGAQPRSGQPPSLSPADAIARAQAATVRIRVDDAHSQAFGTGTIIDTHGEEALVLTCGHMLRDLKPDSVLHVELFGGPQPVSLPAQVVDFDAGETDIGLISFRTTAKLTPAAIMPLNSLPQLGQRVFSFGCDRGADPSRRDTQIKHVNRYLGAANVEIVGAPVVGRSGGGLFDLQGRLIGVCNAADSADDEGIYAGLPVVQQQLQKLGLTRLVDGSNPAAPPLQLASLASTAGARASQPTSQMAAVNEPLVWPDQNAQVNSQLRDLQLSAPAISSTGRTDTTNAPTNGPRNQLICIVRSDTGPDRVVTVNSPSPELLDTIQRQSASK